ncbi:MAG: hypothetical protein V3W18_14120 [candidate division Zixibacteria bacterium]
MNRKYCRTIMIAAAVIILVGCAKNPFSTRGTEDPYGSAGTWETPQSPEAALRNLLSAYNELIISNYQLCFSDSFFFSSPEDSIDAVNDGRGDLFADWDKSVEISAAANLFSTFSTADSLDFYLNMFPANEYADIVEDTTAVMYRSYNLLLVATVENDADTIRAEGLATFHLRQEQLNWWTITWWEDIPAQSGQTDWGDIKAEYRR